MHYSDELSAPLVRDRAVLAANVRAGPVHRDPDNEALVAAHCLLILRPVRMLTGDAAVVVLKERHRRGQVDELGGTLRLHPLAEEAVGQPAYRCPGIPGQVLRLNGGLPGTDQQSAIVVDRYDDWRELRAAIGPRSSQDGPRVC